MTADAHPGVHPQAIVDPGATLGEGVTVGPWTWIGPDVVIGDHTEIRSHVVVSGPTRIGANNRIFQFSSVGEECQDLKYGGEPTTLIIGDSNIIRESCTLHRGTIHDRGETRIGSNNLFMAYVHVAHDCMIGDNTIFANCATLAGHVDIDDHAILGGGTMVHQFCHLGAHAMTAGGSIVLKDVPAFVMAGGQSAGAHGLNIEGLKRRGFSKNALHELRRAYRIVYREGLTLQQAIERLEQAFEGSDEVALFASTLRRAERGIVR